jgi:hypothetical protein
MCNIKRDISYAILYGSLLVYVLGAFLGFAQTSVGGGTDPCSGLSENICQGEGQPCMFWKGVNCSKSAGSFDENEPMCMFKSGICSLNKNWFDVIDKWKRDLPVICKVTERWYRREDQTQFAGLIGLMFFLNLLLTIAFLVFHIMKLRKSAKKNEIDKLEEYVQINRWSIIILAILYLVTGAFHLSLSGALTNEETGCLKIDDDRPGMTKWPDGIQEFEKEYFGGLGVLSLLALAGILHILASIGLGAYTYYQYRYGPEVLSREVQKQKSLIAIPLTNIVGRKPRQVWSGAMAPRYKARGLQRVFT